MQGGVGVACIRPCMIFMICAWCAQEWACPQVWCTRVSAEQGRRGSLGCSIMRAGSEGSSGRVGLKGAEGPGRAHVRNVHACVVLTPRPRQCGACAELAACLQFACILLAVGMVQEEVRVCRPARARIVSRNSDCWLHVLVQHVAQATHALTSRRHSRRAGSVCTHSSGMREPTCTQQVLGWCTHKHGFRSKMTSTTQATHPPFLLKRTPSGSGPVLSRRLLHGCTRALLALPRWPIWLATRLTVTTCGQHDVCCCSCRLGACLAACGFALEARSAHACAAFPTPSARLPRPTPLHCTPARFPDGAVSRRGGHSTPAQSTSRLMASAVGHRSQRPSCRGRLQIVRAPGALGSRGGRALALLLLLQPHLRCRRLLLLLPLLLLLSCCRRHRVLQAHHMGGQEQVRLRGKRVAL